MPQISEETKLQVLAATDIVDLIGSYITVRRQGTAFVALCPFHNEKSPSFNINPARQFFHCFGCKKSGDAISFVRDYENLPFTDAVKKLADRAGIVVKEEITDPREDLARRQRGRLLDINREAAAFMHRLLMRSRDEAQHARDYLKSRGFTSETAVRWTIGWAPARVEVFREWAREKGYTGRELVDAGLLKSGKFGGASIHFIDRLMFPIRDDRGEVVAFSGRQLQPDQKGKYINTSETAVFKKSAILFGLDRARRSVLKTGQSIIICEGQIDTIVCHENGVENAVACQGTAFTAQHAQLLRRSSVKTATLCFDADDAGFKGALAAFKYLAPENIALKMIRMPAGEDPDSFLRKNGAEAFRELVANARDFFDALMDRATEQGRTATPEGRAQLQQEYASLLSLVPDAMMRDALVNKVSTRLRGGSAELRGAVAREGQQAARRQAQPQRPGRVDEDAGPAPVQAAYLDPTVAYLCGLALHSMVAQEWLGEQFETIHEASEYLQGVPVLEAILSGRPDPSSPASVNAFLSGLPEDQRLALYADPTFHADVPENLLPIAEQTLAELSAKYLMGRDARVKADLAQATQGGIDSARMVELLEEVKEIEGLLGGLKQRFTFDERYTTWKKPPKRFENSKFPRGKHERNS